LNFSEAKHSLSKVYTRAGAASLLQLCGVQDHTLSGAWSTQSRRAVKTQVTAMLRRNAIAPGISAILLARTLLTHCCLLRVSLTACISRT